VVAVCVGAVGGRIATTYHAAGTVHRCQPWPASPNLWVNLTADVTGTGARLTCSSSTGVTVEAWFGGMAVCPTSGYTFPDFFSSDSTQEAGNALSVDGDVVVLSANLTYATNGVSQEVLNTSHWRLFDKLDSAPVITHDTTMGVRLRANAVWTGPQTMRMCIGSAKCNNTDGSADGVLDDFFIQTPVPAIDTALYAAIAGLENTYEPNNAWFEGLEGWKSYWCNNYQIDASMHLGGLWTRRARDAILYFAKRPGGPGSIYTASGDRADGRPAGLPYYLLSLYRYWRATGDDALVQEVLFKYVISPFNKIV
jgi:hypothetical protein